MTESTEQRPPIPAQLVPGTLAFETSRREVATADHVEVVMCTMDGVDHDWRPHEGLQFNRPWTWWRCVWCHAVSCGDYGEHDPCMEPYHHEGDHRSRNGVIWPLGGDRP